MATRPAAPFPPAASGLKHSTRASALRRKSGVSNRSSRLPAFISRHSVDLAGRAVALHRDVPGEFDAPLSAHHKVIGRWVAEREQTQRSFSRIEARRHIERAFELAVKELLAPIKLTNLRVAVLLGDDELPPAIAVICDDIGQLDLGWIEKTNVLSNTLVGSVAPVGWRAAAYRALEGTLRSVLALFTYADMLEEFSVYHWDGATTDEGALAFLVDCYGAEAEEAEEMLPSAINAKRPDFMTEKPEALKRMPAALRARLMRLRDAYSAHRAARTAWSIEFDRAREYLPHLDNASHLPPLTLVPFDHFAREIDEVGRYGMETSFMDLAGLFELPDAGLIDEWFASFRLGVDVLRAAFDLIDFDPTGAGAGA